MRMLYWNPLHMHVSLVLADTKLLWEESENAKEATTRAQWVMTLL